MSNYHVVYNFQGRLFLQEVSARLLQYISPLRRQCYIINVASVAIDVACTTMVVASAAIAVALAMQYMYMYMYIICTTYAYCT
jgi:hypothetical protein